MNKFFILILFVIAELLIISHVGWAFHANPTK